MAKLVLNNVVPSDGEVNKAATINNNSDAIEVALENTLSRDGTSPNEMESELDMNSNRIINLPEAVGATEPLRKQEFDNNLGLIQSSVASAQAAQAAAEASANDAEDTAALLLNYNTWFPGPTTGQALKFIRVKADESGYEYVAGGGGGGDALVSDPLSQFAATTSAQLRSVLSDETGTGNAYFQNGDIGTPSAGVATNLTGLPLSSGVVGQLPTANGGTGANLTDPNADRILFWDDSLGGMTWLTAGSGLSITGTTITATGSGDVVGPSSSTDNQLVRFNGTTGKLVEVTNIVASDDAILTFTPTDSARGYEQATRTAVSTYPVLYYRPTTTNKTIAFDIVPRGSPTALSDLYAWIDVCDADVIANGSVALNCARIGVGPDEIKIGSIEFNGATVKPVEFIVGGDGIAYLNTDGLGIGRPFENSSANVGVEFGTVGSFFATRSAATLGGFNRLTNDGNLINLQQDSTTEGVISVSGTTVTYGSFTGSHWSQWTGDDQLDVLEGTILESVDEMCFWPGEDNEQLPKVKVSDTPASKAVYGVFMTYDEDGDFFVTSLGAYKIRIGAGVTVQRGDYIESAGDGTGRVQADDLMRSSTVAKVTSTHVIETYSDGSYTVPCTLHCG